MFRASRVFDQSAVSPILPAPTLTSFQHRRPAALRQLYVTVTSNVPVYTPGRWFFATFSAPPT